MPEKIHQIDKKTWSKWSFYINIIIFILVAVFFYLLIVDSYEAGRLSGELASQAWLQVSRDVAVLAIALTWIFFQLFKNQLLIMRRNW